MIQSQLIILQLNCCSITGITLVYKRSQVFTPKYVSVNQRSAAHRSKATAFTPQVDEGFIWLSVQIQRKWC